MKSPLLDNLMTYLREVMKDYKNEVKEILSADKQLAAEIQYDLKKWEEEQAELKRLQEERVRMSTILHFQRNGYVVPSESHWRSMSAMVDLKISKINLIRI